MSEEQDRNFRIKFGDREYIVMTEKMRRDGLMGDPGKGGEWLAKLGSGTWVVNDQLYAVLLKMHMHYEGSREEMTIGG